MNKSNLNEDERTVLKKWSKALTGMDAALKTTQFQIRDLERIVRNILARVGEA
jgi:hypothetical protein